MQFRLYKYVFGFLFLVCMSGQLFAQEFLDLEAIRLSMSTKGNMDPDTVDMLVTIVKEKLTEYNELGTFFDETDQSFSINKSIEFGELFDQFATIYHDIQSTKYARKNVDLNTYVDDAYTYLKDMGIKYTISDVRIKSINTDASGYYVVDVNLNKNMLVIIEDGEGRILDEPRIINLDFRVELPPDYLEGAKFSFVRGKQRTIVKAKKEKLFHLALGPYYSYGLVNNDVDPASMSTAGLNLAVRHNLAGSSNLFIVGRAYANLLDATYVSTVEGTDSDLFGYTPINTTNQNNELVFYNSGGAETQSTDELSYYYNKVSSSQEKITFGALGLIGAELGLSYSPKTSSTRSRILIDITGGVVVRREADDVRSTLAGASGIFIPNNEENGWPGIANEEILENRGGILDAIERDGRYDWNGDEEIINQDIDAINYYNLTLSPSYQKYFSDKLGLEIGADIFYNFGGNAFNSVNSENLNPLRFASASKFNELGARLKLSIVWNMKKNWY